ncbi:MAG: ATP-binding protein [Planctomycetota bacterium]
MSEELLRVLVVDDEPGMRMGVQRALARYAVRVEDVDVDVRFEVETAETGERAIEVIDARQPDILLLDHKLPGMNGLEVLERIGRRSGLHTVMITAYASLDAAVTAIKQGAYDFLAKPFTPQELKATVRQATESLILTRQARVLAEERRKIRFQFLRVLAHELKAPLNAVEGFLRIVRDQTAGDDPAVYDQMVHRSIDRIGGMRKLILDLLDLTRIESGEKVREVGPVDLRPILDRALETAAPAAEERGIAVHLDAPDAIPMTGDAGELEIVFNNLVSNAVKYNRDGGRVDVRASVDDETVSVAVADTGIGMTPAEQAKLFGEFVRIKNEKTRRISGSGLGLSIVRKLVRLYGGDVTVQSVPDEGSTFTAVMKRHAAPEDAVREEAEGEDDEAAAASTEQTT